MGGGHQRLPRRRHCGRREKSGRQSRISGTHSGKLVSQRSAELEKSIRLIRYSGATWRLDAH